MSVLLKKIALSLAVAFALPLVASAATIDATLIPDGTYTCVVDKVIDATHILVTMENSAQTTLTSGRPNVDFSKVKPDDKLKLSLAKGQVLVFLDLTTKP